MVKHFLSTWRSGYESGSHRLMVQTWILVLACSLWLVGFTPVFSQESYYWLYGKHPALSYLDHPPMVGWWIWLSTAILGDGALGLRAPALLSSLGVTWIGMLLLRRMGGSRRAEILWVLFSISVPAFAMTHFLMLPDGPLVFFWTLTIYALWRARETASTTWWAAAGAAAGCALLSKYSAAFLLPGGLLLLIFDPRMRSQLRRPGPWIGILLSGLFFLPVLIWNAQHDWVSFSFQTLSRYRHSRLRMHWLVQFAISQLGLLLPLLIVAWAAVPWMWNRLVARSPEALWLLAFGLPLPVFMLVNSVAIHVKVNWVLPAYVTLVMALCLWIDQCRIDRAKPRLFDALVITTLTLAVLSLLAPLSDYVPQTGNTNWTGWKHIAQRAEHWEHVLDAEDGIEGDIFFFCENDHDSSQLARNLWLYVPDWNSKERISAQNVFGLRAVGYDYWNDLKAAVGQDAIFVLTSPEHRRWSVDRLQLLFKKVQRVEEVQIIRMGRTVVTAEIYTCKDYAGA